MKSWGRVEEELGQITQLPHLLSIPMRLSNVAVSAMTMTKFRAGDVVITELSHSNSFSLQSNR